LNFDSFNVTAIKINAMIEHVVIIDFTVTIFNSDSIMLIFIIIDNITKASFDEDFNAKLWEVVLIVNLKAIIHYRFYAYFLLNLMCCL